MYHSLIHMVQIFVTCHEYDCTCIKSNIKLPAKAKLNKSCWQISTAFLYKWLLINCVLP